MAGDLLNIGLTGLRAFQNQLATTSHNIANVGTPGYSRQRVELGTLPAEGTGAGFFGNGVQTQTVARLYDRFLDAEVRSAGANVSRLETFQALAAEVDNLLGDPQAGLSPAVDSFFGALNEVTTDPTSPATRQLLLSAAETLANRFRSLDQRLGEMASNVDLRVTDQVASLNGLADNVALLNQRIVEARGQTGGQPPNDLLDQRDALIRQIGQVVDVSIVEQDDGMLNVYMGTGQALVVGAVANRLEAATHPFDPTRREVAIATETGPVIVSDQLTGGELGGLLAFRRDVLDPARNALGKVAAGMALSLNEHHRQGLDLDGQMGGELFSVPAARSLGHQDNTGDAVFQVAPVEAAGLTASDYRLSFDGADYTLTRLSDNTSTVIAAADLSTTTVDGMQLSLIAGTPQPGDRFLIRPARQVPRLMEVAIDDPARIAAAHPVRTLAATDNIGDGRIGEADLANLAGVPLAGDITLTFDPDALGPGVPGLAVSGAAGGPLAYDPASESDGKTFTLSVAGFGDLTFEMDGTPIAGDSFIIAGNDGGSGDNRNVLALADLQHSDTLDGGDATFQEAYAQVVADVAIQTREAAINRDAQQALLEQAQAAHQSVSGVNLDEEAANLVRFQQAYQAAAQVIAVADSVFQTVLQAVGR